MSLADLSIKRPIFITCLVTVMIVIGFICFKNLSVDLLPEINFPMVTITTIYAGAGPEEMETLVTRPIEEEISTISGLRRITSKSLEGMSQITAEFPIEGDIKYAEQLIRDRVMLAKVKLPKDVREPLIKRIDPSDQPILTLSVNADLNSSKLYDVADQVIRPSLEQVSNIGPVDIVGGRKREIQVLVDRSKLHDREISFIQLANQLNNIGENIPSGKIVSGDKETTFRSLGEFKDLHDVSDTVIGLYGNEVSTRISDVGTISDTLEDERTRVFVNGKKSQFINIYKQSGTNTIAVVDAVKKQLEKLRPELETLTGKPQVSVIRDASKYIKDNVRDVYETIMIGIVITLIVVFIFLNNARSTLITGLALPNSLIGAFILLYIVGFSINVITLLALSLAVGLLIDDAIVVRENIFRHMENGIHPKIAAIRGTKEVQLAVIATTLVVIAVFAPMGFVQGIMGPFLKHFGLTICFAMLISLFDALTIAPMLSAYLNKSKNNSKSKVLEKKRWNGFDKCQKWLEKKYESILEFTVRHPLTILLTGLIIFTVSLLSVVKVPGTFTPEQDFGEVSILLDMPAGTSLDAMNNIGNDIEKVVWTNPEVMLLSSVIGGKNGESNKAEMRVKMKPSNDRTITTTMLKDRLREQLKAFTFANPKVESFDPTGGMATMPMALNIIGINIDELEKYSKKVLERLKKDKRLKDVDTNYRNGREEYQVRIKPGLSSLYGITSKNLGEELRAQVEGIVAAKYREDGQEYDIRIRSTDNQRDLISNFNNIFIPNINSKLVKLADVAYLDKAQGPSAIDRQDRGRYIQISADIAAGAGLSEILKDIESLLKNELRPPPGIYFRFVGDSENYQQMSNSLVIIMGLAIVFIYLILSSLYESFITPLTIMLALPLALCGAFLALYLTHQTLNVFALLGIIMLLGVSCKNSILLVDCTKQLIDEGKNQHDAIICAGKTRLRPILMTSFALIAGTIPIALGINEASRERTSMGIAIVGGVISSTLLSLIVVPAVFLYIDRLRMWTRETLMKLTGRNKIYAWSALRPPSPVVEVAESDCRGPMECGTYRAGNKDLVP